MASLLGGAFPSMPHHAVFLDHGLFFGNKSVDIAPVAMTTTKKSGGADTDRMVVSISSVRRTPGLVSFSSGGGIAGKLVRPLTLTKPCFSGGSHGLPPQDTQSGGSCLLRRRFWPISNNSLIPSTALTTISIFYLLSFRSCWEIWWKCLQIYHSSGRLCCPAVAC